MGGVELRVDANDLAGVDAAFQALLRRTANLAPLLDQIGRSLVTSTQQRFETGAAPDGTPWTPSRKPTGDTLVGKGDLRRLMTHRVEGGSVAIGSHRPYARIHQLGGTIEAKGGGWLRFPVPGGGWAQVRSVTLPARPYLGLSEEDRTEIGLIVQDYLRAGLEDAR